MIVSNNMAQCLVCGDVIESKHQHDFVTCSCGQLSVDGGSEYRRRIYTENENWIELSGLTADEIESVRASSLVPHTEDASEAIAKNKVI